MQQSWPQSADNHACIIGKAPRMQSSAAITAVQSPDQSVHYCLVSQYATLCKASQQYMVFKSTLLKSSWSQPDMVPRQICPAASNCNYSQAISAARLTKMKAKHWEEQHQTCRQKHGSTAPANSTETMLTLAKSACTVLQFAVQTQPQAWF